MYFAYLDKRLESYQRRQVDVALASMTSAERQVLRDAHIHARDDVDWSREEKAVWRLAGFLAAAGVGYCKSTKATL
jgi:hypothetical protein